MASPMPLVPPVTSARLPVNSVSEEVLICGISTIRTPFGRRTPRISGGTECRPLHSELNAAALPRPRIRPSFRHRSAITFSVDG